jgi:hypothetical protein
MAGKNRPDPGTTPRPELAGSQGRADALPSFTPGPWAYGHDTCARCAAEGAAEYIIDGPPGGFHGQFSHEPDARLIAAAPDLYEALKALDAFWLEAYPNGPTNPALAGGRLGERLCDETVAIWTALRAALAKAAGHSEPADAAALPRTPESGSSSPGDTK